MNVIPTTNVGCCINCEKSVILRTLRHGRWRSMGGGVRIRRVSMSTVVQPSLVNAIPVAVPLALATADSPARQFAQNGFASIQSLTTPEDITRIRSLLDPLFD